MEFNGLAGFACVCPLGIGIRVTKEEEVHFSMAVYKDQIKAKGTYACRKFEKRFGLTCPPKTGPVEM